MENFIITEKCKTLRMLGKEALRGRWKLAFAAFLIYSVAVYVPNFILSALFSSAPWVASLYSILVSGPFVLGYSIFILCLFRNDEPKVGQIFYGFEKFGKSLGVYLLISIFIALRALLIIPGVIVATLVPFFIPFAVLLLIPAVIASIKYSQAFFVLADNPEIGMLASISKSKSLMAGNKMKYLLLGLSFIGWILLASVPAAIATGIVTSQLTQMDLSGLLSDEQLNEIVYSAYLSSPGTIGLMIISFFAYILLMAYMLASFAAFYEMAAGNLRPGYISTTAEIVDVQQNRSEE